MAAVNGISRGILLVVVVGLIAALGAVLSGFTGVVTGALLVAVLSASILAAFEEYRKLGNKLGPVLPWATVVNILVTAFFLTYGGLLGAHGWAAELGWAIGYLYVVEQELEGVPPQDAVMKLVDSTLKSITPPKQGS